MLLILYLIEQKKIWIKVDLKKERQGYHEFKGF